jgi:hypothetical protein
MRLSLLMLTICVGLVGVQRSAEAQNYPWCAQYGTGFEGMNCGFTTFQQCQDTVSGIGGFCQPNNTYQLSPGPRSSSRVEGRYPY